MSIETTIDLIQTVNRGVSGVTTAPALASYPNAINDADLPYVITVPLDGTWNRKGQGAGWRQSVRTYEILVFLKAIAQSNVAPRVQQAAQVAQGLIDAWLSTANVPLAQPPVYQVTVVNSESGPQSDTGLVADLDYAGVPYQGVRIRLVVREEWNLGT